MEAVKIGLDLGSTAVRAACYGASGQALCVESGAASGYPWPLYERPADNRLGIDFPALKSVLGADVPFTVGGRPSSPGELLEDTLGRIRSQLERRIDGPVRQAVVSVPARYSTVQRTALREAALGAGFTGLQLVSDSACAVVAHTEHQEVWSTVLVCSLGYSGLELALVRAKRGHVRVLAYEGDSVSGGRALDVAVVKLWLDRFRRRGLTFPTQSWDAPVWLFLREEAQTVKQRLSEAERAAFKISVTGQGRRQRQSVITRGAFERVLAPTIAAMTDGVQALLEETSSVLQEIDTVLLVGGSTLIPGVRRAIAELTGKEPIQVAAGELARGAAVHAATLKLEPTGTFDEPSDHSAEQDDGAQRGQLRAASGVRPAGAAPAIDAIAVDGELPADPLPTRAILEEVAQTLTGGGRGADAVARLQELERDVRAVLDGLDAKQRPSTAPAAARALARAERLLTRGEYEEAVRDSHIAWQRAQDDPDVFDRMIEIHCEAAIGDGVEREHADAIRWLTCAYGHDRSNQHVRDLLAERYYAQARELAGEHRRDEALQAIGSCLTWRPDYPNAQELQHSLKNP